MKKAIFKTEAFDITIPIRSYKESHGITMCCVVLNEEAEIGEFLKYHRPYFKNIIMIDGGSSDKTVDIATPIVDEIIINKFTGHYSNQVNRVTEKVATDWTIFLDCDERLDIQVMTKLDTLINQEEFDCYAFPRRNFIEGKFIDINYQDRLHRTYCRRVRPVHGEVVGYKNKKTLPAEEGNFIQHFKTTNRHLNRNNGYAMYELKYKHEMGAPGSQTENSFNMKYPLLREDNFTIV